METSMAAVQCEDSHRGALSHHYIFIFLQRSHNIHAIVMTTEVERRDVIFYSKVGRFFLSCQSTVDTDCH